MKQVLKKTESHGMMIGFYVLTIADLLQSYPELSLFGKSEIICSISFCWALGKTLKAQRFQKIYNQQLRCFSKIWTNFPEEIFSSWVFLSLTSPGTFWSFCLPRCAATALRCLWESDVFNLVIQNCLHDFLFNALGLFPNTVYLILLGRVFYIKPVCLNIFYLRLF